VRARPAILRPGPSSSGPLRGPYARGERWGLRLLAVGLLLRPAAPALAAEQATLGVRAEEGATVLGRVCLDIDGNGSCDPGEPGVSGARIVTAAGQVALADPRGRFHLLDVPARVLAGDRVAYGGQRVAVEGFPGARALLDIAPDGAAPVALALGAPPFQPPALEAAGLPGAAPRRDGGRLRWSLGGRTVKGATVAVDGAPLKVYADGSFVAEVSLSPGDNPLGVAIATSDGRGALLRWVVHLAPRASGGDLVIPGRPELLASFAATPAGGGALVHGKAAPGTRVRVAGLAAQPEASGAFAAYARVEDEGPHDPSRATTSRTDVDIALDDGKGAPVSLALPVRSTGELTAAALGEVEVSFGGGSDVVVTGRGTGSMSGHVGALDVAAGVDVDDRDRKLADLARPRDGLGAEHALDPERSFLTTGDDGASDDRNAPRGRLWARAEAPGARLDLGNARTGLVPATGAELGRYDRSMFGLRAALDREVGFVHVEASAFGATLRPDAGGNVPPRPVRDALAAHGGAFYWLSRHDIVPGSEVVRVEWRDPFTGLATARRALTRTVDYEIDWVSGRVVLSRPLPSVAPPAALETGPPTAASAATLVVEYLSAATTPDAEDLQGGRAALSYGPAAVEARVAHEERPDAPYRLESGAASLDLGVVMLRGEAARSHGDPGGAPVQRSQDGGYAFTSAASSAGGDALHLEARGAAGPATYAAWWRERGAGYADGAFQALSDEHERGATVDLASGAWGGGLTYAERAGADAAQPVGAPPEDARRIVARGRWTGESLELVAEATRFEQAEPVKEEANSVGGRVIWHLDPRLSLDLSHHQGFAVTGPGADPTFTAAGASLELGRTRLDVRGGWGPDLGPRLVASGEVASGGESVYGTFTADPDATPFGAAATGDGASAAALGARRRAGSTEVFTEENVGRDLWGLRTARVFGLAVEPARGLRLTLTGERGVRLAPDGSDVDRTAVAGSAGASLGPVRLGLRGEVRREGVGQADAAGGSLDWRASERLTLSARTSWADGDLGGVKAHLFEVSGGGALRLDHGGLLATVSSLDERRPGGSPRKGVLGRLAGTADVGSRLAVGAAVAAARQEVAGAREDRLVGSVRASVRVVGPVDLGAEAARRGPIGGGDVGVRSALRAELGVRLGTGLAASEGRLALGWQMVGFTGDGLAPRDETGRLFLRAQLAY